MRSNKNPNKLPSEPVTPALSAGVFVFYALCRASADTGHAVGTVSAPNRLSIFKAYIVHRAKLLALSAGYAFLFQMEAFVLH